jgi:hypothetical protein
MAGLDHRVVHKITSITSPCQVCPLHLSFGSVDRERNSCQKHSSNIHGDGKCGRLFTNKCDHWQLLVYFSTAKPTDMSFHIALSRSSQSSKWRVSFLINKSENCSRQKSNNSNNNNNDDLLGV